MIIKNLKEVPFLNDVEIAPGVLFGEHTWRIDLGNAEHVTFNFRSLLDAQNTRSCDYPDLLDFIKILTAYTFVADQWDAELAFIVRNVCHDPTFCTRISL